MATKGRYRPDWTIGTLTLVEGEKEFTTTGSALEVAGIQPGDSIITASGLTLIIESITGQNSGTLMHPCSMIAAGADQPLRIRYQPEGSRLAGMAASLFQRMGSGALYSLGELEGEEGQFLRFLAPGVLEAVAGENLGSLAALELVKNNVLGVDNDGKLTMMPREKALLYGAAQTLTPAERGQAVANIGAGVLAGFRNKIINGGFDIWQRGTVFSYPGNSLFLADRWRIAFDVPGVFNVVRGDAGAITLRGSPNYYLAWVQTDGPPAQFRALMHRVEGVETLAGKTATFTLTGWCDIDRTLTVEFRQHFGDGGSPLVTTGHVPFSLKTTPSTTSVVVDIPPITGKTRGTGANFLEIVIYMPASGAFTTNLARISLVEGDAREEEDPFSPRHIALETMLCERYARSIKVRALESAQFAGWWVQAASAYPKMRTQPTYSTFVEYAGGVNLPLQEDNAENGFLSLRTQASAAGAAEFLARAFLEAEL